MKKPKKMTGWSINYRADSEQFIITINADDHESAVRKFSRMGYRVIDPSNVKRTATVLSEHVSALNFKSVKWWNSKDCEDKR